MRSVVGWRLTTAIVSVLFVLSSGCRSTEPTATTSEARTFPTAATPTTPVSRQASDPVAMAPVPPAAPALGAEDDANQESLATLETIVVGRGDTDVGLLALHGYGARGDDLVGLAQRLAEGCGVRALVPAAPNAAPGGSGTRRQWWGLRRRRSNGERRDRSDEDPEGLTSSRRHLIRILDVAKRELGLERFIVLGFSQGAMLATDLALNEERAVALIAYSGTLLAQTRWQAALESRSPIPALMTHGRQDRVLSFSRAKRTATLFRGAGWPVEWMPFDGGHAIPERARTAAAEVLCREARR